MGSSALSANSQHTISSRVPCILYYMADHDLEEKIFSKINSYKQRNPRKSIIAGFQQPSHRDRKPLEATTQQSPGIKQQPTEPNEKQQDQNLQAQILAKFDQMLMLRMRPIEDVLTSIENKVDKIDPKLEVQVDNTRMFNKVERSINESLDKSISGIKSSLSMSINYYNNELCERQKRFNREHEETARLAIENHKSIIQTKGKRGEVDFKRLQERIKMLMRSENKCEDMLVKIDKQLNKISDAVKDYQDAYADANFKTMPSEEFLELSQEEMLEMLFENYEFNFDTPRMREYLYEAMGINAPKKK